MKTIAKRTLLLIAAVAAIGFASTTPASAQYYHNGYYHHGYYGYHRGYYGYYGGPYHHGYWGYRNGVRVWIVL
jgi:hypothetical protein